MENREIALLSFLVIVISSLSTVSLLGSQELLGRVTDTGTVSLSITEVGGCALHNVDGVSNTSVVFTATPDQTVQTDNGDSLGGTIILNNTGNSYLNVTINSTNTSTGGFFQGTSVGSDYQIKAGNFCEVNGDTTNLTTTEISSTAYTDTNGSFRELVGFFNFSTGNNSCDVDFKLHVPADEPIGDKLDRVYIQCTPTLLAS